MWNTAAKNANAKICCGALYLSETNKQKISENQGRFAEHARSFLAASYVTIILLNPHLCVLLLLTILQLHRKTQDSIPFKARDITT